MQLGCNPEDLRHFLTPILPYLRMTCVKWHGGQIWHFWHFWHKWRIWHAPYVIARYGNMGVKRCVRTSGLKTNVVRQLVERFNSSKFLLFGYSWHTMQWKKAVSPFKFKLFGFLTTPIVYQSSVNSIKDKNFLGFNFFAFPLSTRRTLMRSLVSLINQC